MSYNNLILAELREAQFTLESFIQNDKNLRNIEEAAILIVDAIKSGGKVISCGNGGSHCDAMHFAEELTGRYRADRAALPAIAISDVSHISCVGNDYGYDSIFSRFIEGLGKGGDILLAISTSGNSANILKACSAAKQKNMKIISLTGKGGGELGPLSNIEIRVEHNRFSDRTQEIHIKVIHILILLIEKLIFEK